MTADQEPRYGRVRLSIGWYGWVVSFFLSFASLSFALGPGMRSSGALFMGLALCVSVLLLLQHALLGIPSVETSPEGVTIRPWSGRGRIFVRWEDVQGVVIWHSHRGGNRSTMVAVIAADGFAYDNYGLFPTIRPVRNPPHSRNVKRHIRSRSVDTAKTSAAKIAELIIASGKGVAVYEELPHGDIWNHAGPQ